MTIDLNLKSEINQLNEATEFERTLIIAQEEGLHARPAGMIAKKASSFQSKVEVSCGGQTANAKSIMMIMSLGIEKGAEIKIKAHGIDAQLAVKTIEGLILNGFTGS
jgi:phosphocarrier protein